MKKSIVLASFVTLALSAPLAFSEEAHHAPDKKTTSAKPADMADKQTEKQMAQMQEQMKKMQAQMSKINKTTDPKERQQLMQEHMHSMLDGMKEMRGMCGDMKKGGSMMHGEMMGGDMMEKRMDMMQMMMEQMMEHQNQQAAMPLMK